jgi:hypothetical protein
MTPIDTSTEAVERLLDGVTPGPWKIDAANCIYAGSPDAGTRYDVARCVFFDGDASFTVAARDLVPALLKERDDLRAKMAGCGCWTP